MSWRGLAEVAIGADPPPRGWHSPWRRRIVYAVFGAATVLLCAATTADKLDGPGKKPLNSVGKPYGMPPHGAHVAHNPPVGLFGRPADMWALLALGIVVPLMLAARYPLMGWRIGWIALVLAPILHVRWWAGLPWDLAQVLTLLVVVCVAGLRHERPALAWLWALTLAPWWFWVVRQGPGVVTAALGSMAFLVMAVAVDRVGSERRARRDLAEQAEQAEL